MIRSSKALFLLLLVFSFVSCSTTKPSKNLRDSYFENFVSLEKTDWNDSEKEEVLKMYKSLLDNIRPKVDSSNKTREVALKNLLVISEELDKTKFSVTPYEDVLFPSDFFVKKKADQVTLSILYHALGVALKLPISVETDEQGSAFWVRYRIGENGFVDWLPDQKTIQTNEVSAWKGDYPSKDPVGLIIRESAWKSFLNKNFASARDDLLFNQVASLPEHEMFGNEIGLFSVYDHKKKTLDCDLIVFSEKTVFPPNKIDIKTGCYLAQQQWGKAIPFLEKQKSNYLSAQFLVRAYFFQGEYQKALGASEYFVKMLQSSTDNKIPGKRNLLYRELKFQNGIQKKISKS